MKIETFRRIFKSVNGFYITDDVLFFRKPLYFWNEKNNEESEKFKTLDEALEYKIGDKTAREIIADLDEMFTEPKR